MSENNPEASALNRAGDPAPLWRRLDPGEMAKENGEWKLVSILQLGLAWK
jgi:hypothetical protein